MRMNEWQELIEKHYVDARDQRSDINEHLHDLLTLAVH